MNINKFLITDLVVHIFVVTIKDLVHKLIKCILGVILPGKLPVKVHLFQTRCQLHEVQVSGIVLVVHTEALFAVFVVFFQMVLKIDVIFVFSVENFSEVGRLVYKDHFVEGNEVAQGELLHGSGAVGAELEVEGLQVVVQDQLIDVQIQA